jgi:hypothetical protein
MIDIPAMHIRSVNFGWRLLFRRMKGAAALSSMDLHGGSMAQHSDVPLHRRQPVTKEKDDDLGHRRRLAQLIVKPCLEGLEALASVGNWFSDIIQCQSARPR